MKGCNFHNNCNKNNSRRKCFADCDCGCPDEFCEERCLCDTCCSKCNNGIQGPAGPQDPAGNAAALTVTPLAGGTRPVSAHLVITQIG